VLAELSKLDAAALSPEEHLNFEVYRAQIQVERNDVAFREYERPVNSDSQFWGFIAPIDGRGFRTAEYYRRYLLRLKDVPEFVDEQMANMRAGAARGFTPPRVTLEGRDQGLKDVVNAKSAQETSFWRPFLNMPASIPTEDQAKLRAEAEDVILHKVVPAYAKMLTFWR
jgi:uncharacterized protein (DUF885 family)